jgi:hypothetical protein
MLKLKKQPKTYIALASILIIGILLLAGFLLFPPETSKPQPDWAGICVHTLPAEDARLVNESSARWIRIDISNNQTDLNSSLANAKDYNLSVLGILGSWMFNKSCIFTLDDWKSNVTYYVSQYAPYVDAWEIWNEPTSPNPDWQLQVDYLSMAQTASLVIREYDPAAKIVLLGGMQLYTGSSTDYLEGDKVFAANLSAQNITKYGDAISVHAYPWSGNVTSSVWDNYKSSLEFYRGLFPGMEIWVTETGQPIEDADETGQSQYLNTALSFFKDKADKVFWYALHDSVDDGKSFGLIQNNGNPREAYNTLQKALAPITTGLFLCHSNK